MPLVKEMPASTNRRTNAVDIGHCAARLQPDPSFPDLFKEIRGREDGKLLMSCANSAEDNKDCYSRHCRRRKLKQCRLLRVKAGKKHIKSINLGTKISQLGVIYPETQNAWDHFVT